MSHLGQSLWNALTQVLGGSSSSQSYASSGGAGGGKEAKFYSPYTGGGCPSSRHRGAMAPKVAAAPPLYAQRRWRRNLVASTIAPTIASLLHLLSFPFAAQLQHRWWRVRNAEEFSIRSVHFANNPLQFSWRVATVHQTIQTARYWAQCSTPCSRIRSQSVVVTVYVWSEQVCLTAHICFRFQWPVCSLWTSSMTIHEFYSSNYHWRSIEN
jgi:hypothetical protein